MNTTTSPIDQIQEWYKTYNLASKLPLLTALLAIAALRLLFYSSNPKHNADIKNIPIIGKEYGTWEERSLAFARRGKEFLNEGYRKYKGGVFQVATTEGPNLFVMGRFIKELRNQPDEVVSFNARAEERMLPQYSLISQKNLLGVHSVKGDLTPNLARLLPHVVNEIETAVAEDIGDCKEWTPLEIYGQVARVVSKAGFRMFVGPDLCRNEAWIKLSIGYTTTTFAGAEAIRKWHPWLRPLVYRWVPQLQAVRKMKSKALSLLTPVINARRAANYQTDEEKPEDMLQWMYDKCNAVEKNDYEYQLDLQLVLGLATIHSTTMLTTNVLYDLVSRPEYIEPLREEIQEVLAQNGGIFTKYVLEHLKKMDSFMRESQRWNPMNFSGFVRKILVPFTLSDGTYIPAGTNFEVPVYAMSRDPQICPGPNPDVFDGYRFYNARQRSEKEANGHQLVTVTTYTMWFGYGHHACPGRFFASYKMKLMLANILLKYDIKFPDGEVERYRNMEFETNNFPDPSKVLMFKRRGGDTISESIT